MVYKCKWFKIQELVSKETYNYFKSRYGEDFLWGFFDPDILKDLDDIREAKGSSIIINNWHIGGTLNQCGLRTNIDQIVKEKTLKGQIYVSGHCLAVAFDLHDGKGDNKSLHNLVCNMIKTKKLKKFRRVESLVSAPTWTHTDGFQTNNDELVVFKV